MRILAIILISVSILVVGCNDSKIADTGDVVTDRIDSAANPQPVNLEKNPFFQDYDTPFGIPPFDKITNAHFTPAFDKALADWRSEVLAITNSSAEPTFENTIVALEYSGQLVAKVRRFFFNLTSAHTNDELEAIAKDVGPRISAVEDDINLNPELFKRVESVYKNMDSLDLRVDQRKLLVDRYKEFIRGGTHLVDKDKLILRDLNAKLSRLGLEFADNVLAETNNFELVIDKKEDLAGLPQYLINAAAIEATKRNEPGKWVFTTHRPSKTPFLMYSEKRALRRAMWDGYTHRGDNNNANDNKKIAAEIAALRVRKAKLLGYESHAHFVLEESTAKNSENIHALLNTVWQGSLAQAKQDLADMQRLVDVQGGGYKVEAWDWRFLEDKIRKERYALDEEQTKSYFSLENTLKGVFYTVNKLYGLTFKERTDLPVYQEDVRVFEVYDENREQIGLYLADFFVRDSKEGGAWSDGYRRQHVTEKGDFVKPIVVNVFNFPPPTENEPSLLTLDQASTLFHEFGHAIHALFGDITYPSQARNLPADFVEFPSRLLEYWMYEPEVLEKFALHYQTGEVIPSELVDKIQAAAKFGEGFATTEYIASTFLDLAWHTRTNTDVVDANEFEAKVLADIGLIPQIAPRYRSTYFGHIFGGSGFYSAAYYGYIWSEILAADTFHLYKQKGIFNQKTAKNFRKLVLSKGGADDPIQMYREFRGQEPDAKHLLNDLGLVSE
jgi:peptidyl-dipeptidase Dcp